MPLAKGVTNLFPQLLLEVNGRPFEAQGLLMSSSYYTRSHLMADWTLMPAFHASTLFLFLMLLSFSGFLLNPCFPKSLGTFP